jgi:cytosolic carboxypeptidase protein 5
MYAKDKGDGLSKEGAGRVALYKQTKMNLCYTLECNYNMGNITNRLVKMSEPSQPAGKNFLLLLTIF